MLNILTYYLKQLRYMMLLGSFVFGSTLSAQEMTQAERTEIMAKILPAINFMLFDEKKSVLKKTVLKKTGQTQSYDATGTVVTDGSLKDDGFYQKGITPKYTRDDGNEIVTDHITKLQWQDDADVSTILKPWLTQTNYDICRGQNGQTQDTAKCIDITGDTASTYCSNLTLGGYTNWRLPTIDEFMYIADRSKSAPGIDTTVFQNVVSNFSWSSSTVVGNENNAWFVHFGRGNDIWSNKSNSYYVRCVRDGE